MRLPGVFVCPCSHLHGADDMHKLTVEFKKKNLQDFQGEESDECVIVDVVYFIVIKDSAKRHTHKTKQKSKNNQIRRLYREITSGDRQFSAELLTSRNFIHESFLLLLLIRCFYYLCAEFVCVAIYPSELQGNLLRCRFFF